MKVTKVTDITNGKIIAVLRKCSSRASAAEICDALGIKRGRTGRYSNTAYRIYIAVGYRLQELKRAGEVEFVGGSGAGWRITKVF